MSQSTTLGIVNIKLAAYLALTSSTLSGRARVRNKQLLKIDNNGMLIAVTDWLWNETYYLITDVTGPAVKTTAGVAGDAALLVRFAGLQLVSASGTVTANQGSAGVARWPVTQSSNAAIASFQVTTSAGVATQLTPATLAAVTFLIRNTDAVNPVWLGGSGVTSTTGFQLPAGTVIPGAELYLSSGQLASALYAIDNGVNTVTLHGLVF